KPPLTVLEKSLGDQIDTFGAQKRVALDPREHRQQHRHAGLAEHLPHVVEEQVPNVEVERGAGAPGDQTAEEAREQPRARGYDNIVAPTSHLAQCTSRELGEDEALIYEPALVLPDRQALHTHRSLNIELSGLAIEPLPIRGVAMRL